MRIKKIHNMKLSEIRQIIKNGYKLKNIANMKDVTFENMTFINATFRNVIFEDVISKDVLSKNVIFNNVTSDYMIFE